MGGHLKDHWTEARTEDLSKEARIGDLFLEGQREGHLVDAMEDLKVKVDLSKAWDLMVQVADSMAHMTTDSISTKNTIPWTWTMIPKDMKTQA